MNNSFSNFVKKAKALTLIKVIGLFLGVVVITIIAVETMPILVIACTLVFFWILFFIIGSKKRKQILKYKLGIDFDNNIYVPLVFDNDYLKKISNELNNSIEIPNDINNLVNYVQYMINSNQMIFIKENFKLDDIINLLNDLMKHQNINYSIDKSEIIKTDEDFIALRRKDDIKNDIHDLSAIRMILEKNQLELIVFFAPNDGFSKLARINGYVLTIIPINKVDALRKHHIELTNKLNYK